ncbi:MAG: NADH-quinone oxidoreductase subunit C [Dehalococcoidales bacterium]|nr:NADH-quinone oxidoreductase subunit C [Dehalococcoidales bacterium]
MIVLSGKDTAAKIEPQLPGSVVESGSDTLIVKKDSLLAVATLLKQTAGLDFDYLASVTSTDYGDYFEVVYHLTSMQHTHSLILKTRIYGRDNPTVPSVISLWKGADLQEREIFDLMGIKFEDHPNMKRIVLYEGFEGHPLRKDYWEWTA